MQLVKEVIIDAPADKVWAVVGENYSSVGDWASIINVSGARVSDSGKLEGRTCESTYGSVKEMLTHYDEDERVLSYQADGLPAMFKEGGNTWRVERLDANHTRVTMDLRMKFALIPGFFMGWMIKGKMNKDTDQLMQDLKHFVETGRPTKAKKDSDAKFHKKKGKAAA